MVPFSERDNTLLAVKMASSHLDPKGHALPTVTLAANVVFIAPLVMLFLLEQKYIRRGAVTSSLKE